MANTWYPKGKEALLKKQINVTSDTLKIALLSASYTYSSTHDFLDDVAGGAILSTATLASVTATNGILDADDPTFSAVAGGDTGTQLIIYHHTGTGSTSELLLHIDTATNLPVVTNGGDIPVNFNASGIAEI